MKKYFKNKYLSPRSPNTRTPERERDDRLDCNKIKTTLNANADFASFSSGRVTKNEGLATKNNNNNNHNGTTACGRDLDD